MKQEETKDREGSAFLTLPPHTYRPRNSAARATVRPNATVRPTQQCGQHNSAAPSTYRPSLSPASHSMIARAGLPVNCRVAVSLSLSSEPALSPAGLA